MGYAASAACLDKLCSLEGFRALPYQDGGGLWTIGYGRRCAQSADATTPEAERTWVEAQLTQLCGYLNHALPSLSANQVDAVLLFGYNIGWQAFITSDTYKFLSHHDWRNAFQHWSSWIRDNSGRVEAGLVARREYEIELFIFGCY